MSTVIQHSELVDEPRGKVQAILRGALGRCPACGKGAMFRAYLKVSDACPVCHEELHHQRADDAPPYVTMFIVAHLVVTLVLATELLWIDPPFWLEATVWSIVTVGLSLLLLPRVKGALVALQWSLRMHGFDARTPHDEAVTSVG